MQFAACGKTGSLHSLIGPPTLPGIPNTHVGAYAKLLAAGCRLWYSPAAAQGGTVHTSSAPRVVIPNPKLQASVGTSGKQAAATPIQNTFPSAGRGQDAPLPSSNRSSNHGSQHKGNKVSSADPKAPHALAHNAREHIYGGPQSHRPPRAAENNRWIGMGDVLAATSSLTPLASLEHSLSDKRSKSWAPAVITQAMKLVSDVKIARCRAATSPAVSTDTVITSTPPTTSSLQDPSFSSITPEDAPYNAQELRVMGILASLLRPHAPNLQNIKDPITALFSCARGSFWPAELCTALLARLAQDKGAVLRKQANAQSFANLFWVMGKAAECSGGSSAMAVAGTFTLSSSSSLPTAAHKGTGTGIGTAAALVDGLPAGPTAAASARAHADPAAAAVLASGLQAGGAMEIAAAVILQFLMKAQTEKETMISAPTARVRAGAIKPSQANHAGPAAPTGQHAASRAQGHRSRRHQERSTEAAAVEASALAMVFKPLELSAMLSACARVHAATAISSRGSGGGHHAMISPGLLDALLSSAASYPGRRPLNEWAAVLHSLSVLVTARGYKPQVDQVHGIMHALRQAMTAAGSHGTYSRGSAYAASLPASAAAGSAGFAHRTAGEQRPAQHVAIGMLMCAFARLHAAGVYTLPVDFLKQLQDLAGLCFAGSMLREARDPQGGCGHAASSKLTVSSTDSRNVLHSLSLVMYSSAVMGVRAGRTPLITQLAEACLTHGLCNMTSQSLGIAAWGAAKMEYANPQFYAAVCDAAMLQSVMQDAQPQAWTTLLHALANARHHDPRIFQAMEQEMLRPLAPGKQTASFPTSFSPAAGVSRTASLQQAIQGQQAVADNERKKGRPQPANCKSRSSSKTRGPLRVIDLCDGQHCTTTLWSAAILDMQPSDELTAACLAVATQAVAHGHPLQTATNCLWALVVLGQLGRHQAAAEALMMHAVGRGADALGEDEKFQLFKVHVEAQRLNLGPGLMLHGSLLATTRASVLEQLENVANESVSLLKGRRSEFHAGVLEALREMQSAPTAGRPTAATANEGPAVIVTAVPQSEQVVFASPGRNADKPNGSAAQSPGAQRGAHAEVRHVVVRAGGAVSAQRPAEPEEWLLIVDCIVQVQVGASLAHSTPGPTTGSPRHKHTTTATSAVSDTAESSKWEQASSSSSKSRHTHAPGREAAASSASGSGSARRPKPGAPNDLTSTPGYGHGYGNGGLGAGMGLDMSMSMGTLDSDLADLARLSPQLFAPLGGLGALLQQPQQQQQPEPVLVAVEADGPWHFFTNKPDVYGGPSHLRNAWLRQAFAGRLLLLPYTEWQALAGRGHSLAAARVQYLRDKLTELLAAPQET